MDRYAVKLTIGGMIGAFAEKYSYTVTDAHILNRFLQETTAKSKLGPIELLARHDDPYETDAFNFLPRLMSALRKVAREHAERRFFTGARFEPEDAEPHDWQAQVAGANEAGELTVEAFGRKAHLVTGSGDDATRTRLGKSGDEITVPTSGGLIRLRFATRKTLFRQDLENMVNMCEEALAKNESLIATTLPPDAAPSRGAGMPEL